jgi:hypothetical protein
MYSNILPKDGRSSSYAAQDVPNLRERNHKKLPKQENESIRFPKIKDSTLSPSESVPKEHSFSRIQLYTS